jgi:hypothetical protein
MGGLYMKPDLFRLLWSRCLLNPDASLSGEEFHNISTGERKTLQEEQIIWKSHIPDDILLPQHGLKVAASIVESADKEEVEIIPQDLDGGEPFTIPRRKVEFFPILLDILARRTAELWGITTDFRPVKPSCFMLGWKDKDMAVVLVQRLIASGATEAKEIKNQLGGNSVAIISLERANLTGTESEQLEREEIYVKSARQFLTDDCSPRWNLINREEAWRRNLVPPWGFDDVKGKFTFKDNVIDVRKMCVEFLKALWTKQGEMVSREELILALPFRGDAEKELRRVYNEIQKEAPPEAFVCIKHETGAGYGIFPPK